MIYNKIRHILLYIFLTFAVPSFAEVFDLSCQKLDPPDATQSQLTTMRSYCQNLQWLLNEQLSKKEDCAGIVSSNLSSGPYGVINIHYEILHQCQGDIIETEQNYTASWLADGRRVSAKAVWASLNDEDQAEILDELKNDQELGATCPRPSPPSSIEIQNHVVTFSNFYPSIANPVQKQACDISIIRPPQLTDAYLALETEMKCALPLKLLEQIEMLRLMAPYFNQDADINAAKRTWQAFPKNYFELVAMVGSWWLPGWETAFSDTNTSLRILQETETSAISICNGSLSDIAEKQILPAWYSLYDYIPKDEWVANNIRLQAGLWQLGGVNFFADFTPEELEKNWDKEAEQKAWINVTIEDLTGLYFWINSDPNIQDCSDESSCETIDPIDPEKFNLDEAELINLKRKLNAAKAAYLK